MGFKNFLEFFQFKDEDDDYDDDDDEDEVVENRRPARVERTASRPSAPTPAPSRQPSFKQAPVQEAPALSRQSVRMERTSNNKVVPIKTTSRNFEVCIMKPTGFTDAQDICDMLLAGRAAVVNLEGFDPNEAQRIMDFILGCIYTMNGRFHQISRYIFIFSPESVDISGDYQEIMNDNGNFGVPTISKEF